MDSLTSLTSTRHAFGDSPTTSKSRTLMQEVMPQSEASYTNTTFFIDSDVDSESETGETFEEPSPVDDAESFDRQSTSASSPADHGTPQTQHAESSPNLMYRLKSIKRARKHSGAEEELCFRATMASGTLDWESYQPDPVTDPVPAMPSQSRPLSPEAQPTQPKTALQEVRQWTTQQVAAWMLNCGFDNFIISNFRTHDINGAVLLDLAFDDLKDLDVSSYAKRQQIWNEIGALRFDGTLDDPLHTTNTGPQRIPSCVDLPETGPSGRAFYPEYQRDKQARSRASSASTRRAIQGPHSSSSGTACPQDIPKPHRCSKGEKCSKWQKQQTALDEVDKEHGPNTPPTENRAKMSDSQPAALYSTPPPTQLDATTATASPESASIHPAAPQSTSDIQYVPDLQHVVQPSQEIPPTPGISSSSSNATLTASTPRLEPFPSSSASPSFTYPPRQSSRDVLPRLSIPGSPTAARHTPCNSDSSIINLNWSFSSLSTIDVQQRPARSTSVPPPMSEGPASPIPPIVLPLSPRSVVPPLVTPKSRGLRSPGPMSASRNSSARTGSPNGYSPRVPYRDGSVGQDDSLSTGKDDSPPLVPAPLFNRTTTLSPDPSIPRTVGRSTTPSPDISSIRAGAVVTGKRPPLLRAPLSADTLPLRRNVTPLPTLLESSHNKASPISKPLPATPRKSASSNQSGPPAAAVPPPVPAFTNLTTTTSTITVPPTPMSSRQELPPPTPLRGSPTKTSTTVPTPTTASTTLSSPPIPTPATPFTPFTPMTPMTPRTPAASTIPFLSGKLPRQAYGPMTLSVGWVRRRRARLWRHEWSSAHLRLTNSTLAIHATANPSDVTPLETIDVDDYVVACSSVAGGGGTGGKLVSAVRSLRLYSTGSSSANAVSGKNGMMGSGVVGGANESNDGGGGGAFSWQLVPAAAVGEKAGHVRTEKNGDGEDTTIVVKSSSPEIGSSDSPTTDSRGTGNVGPSKDKEKEREKVVLKTHHFAVRTRDERIDWMREVMLAKALRQKELLKAAENRAKVKAATNAGSAADREAQDLKGAEMEVETSRLARSGSF